jgi:phage-related protein
LSNVGFATLTIIPSARGFGSALGGEVNPAMSRAGAEGGGLFGKSLMPSLGGLAVAAGSLFAAVGVGGFFKDAVAGAANLEQSVGAIETVFKGSAPQMLEWADSAATAVGLTKNEYSELGTLIGTQLRNGGTAMDELAPKTNNLIGLGADLSSMFGGSTSEAVSALSSALKGERDPIERYGVSLTQAAIDAKAAELGFAKVGGTLDAEANQAATLALIMDQTADAHGNFGREADTLSHKQQVLNAMWEDGKTRIGGALVPAISGLASILIGALGPALDGAERGITKVTEVAGGVFNILGKGDFTPFAGLQEDSGIVDFLFNIRETAIGVTDILFKGDFSGPFLGLQEDSAFVDFLFTLRDAAISFGTSFGATIQAAGAAFAPFLPAIGAAFSSLVGPLAQILPAISPFGIVLQGLMPILPAIAALVGQLAATLGAALGQALAVVAPLLVTLGQTISGTLAAVLPMILPLIATLGTIFATLVPVIASVVAAVVPLVTTLISQLAPIFIQLVSSVLPPVISIIGMLVTAIAPVITTIAGVLIPIISALLPVVTTVFGVIADVIGAAMTIIQGIIQVVTGIITGNWSQVWDGIKNILSGVWDAIKAVIMGAVATLQATIGAALSIISGLWSGAWNGIKAFISGAWAGITGAVSAGITSVLSFFSGLGQKVLGGIGDLGGLLTGVGRNMIEGLLEGVKAVAGKIKDAVLGPIKDSVEAVKGFLGIHSPSRLMRGVGRNYGEGYRLGVLDEVADTDDAMLRLATPPTSPDAPPAPAPGGLTGAIAGAVGRRTGGDVTNIYEAVSAEATAQEVARRKKGQDA